MSPAKRRRAQPDQVSIHSIYGGADLHGRAIAHWFLATLTIIVVAAAVVLVCAINHGWSP